MPLWSAKFIKSLPLCLFASLPLFALFDEPARPCAFIFTISSVSTKTPEVIPGLLSDGGLFYCERLGIGSGHQFSNLVRLPVRHRQVIQVCDIR